MMNRGGICDAEIGTLHSKGVKNLSSERTTSKLGYIHNNYNAP
jgi:hypothetical protein